MDKCELKVTPIYKSGDKSDPNNYRPISVLPLISKVKKRAIQSQLTFGISYKKQFFISTSIRIPKETCHRNCHCTFCRSHLRQIDKRRITRSIFVDLKNSVAFDLVDHHCLLHKVEHYEIRGKSLSNGLNTILLLEPRRSVTKTIRNGVPQGSILGPILFVIYINDLPQILLKSSLSMYADDTVICFSDSSAEIIKQVLQNDLNNVEQWL